MGGVYPGIERKLAHSRGVRAAVKVTAEEIAVRARARLAAHRDTGAASIVVEHGAVDSYVVLDDPASLSIEFGHGEYTRADGHHVGASQGLNILRGSL